MSSAKRAPQREPWLWVMMTCPHQLQQVHHLVGLLVVGEAVRGAGGRWETSEPSFQFCCELKPVLNKHLFKKKKRARKYRMGKRNKHKLIVLPTFLFCRIRTVNHTYTVYFPLLKIKKKRRRRKRKNLGIKKCFPPNQVSWNKLTSNMFTMGQ